MTDEQQRIQLITTYYELLVQWFSTVGLSTPFSLELFIQMNQSTPLETIESAIDNLEQILGL